MPRIILCPVDGERLTTETRTNAAGDTLQRYLCPSADYSTEWRAVTLAPAGSGDVNTLLPESTEWFRDATEYTAGRMESSLRTRLDGLLDRIGTVGGDNVTLLDNLTRVYRAVDQLEVTTDNIRIEAGTINLATDELEALLGTLNTNISGGSRQLTEAIRARRARDGRAFLASSTRLSASGAGHFRAAIRNPAGSGRTLYMDTLVMSMSVGPVWTQMFLNPTLNLPAITRTTNNVLVGAATGVGVMLADVDAVNPLGGGTDMQVTMPGFTGRNEYSLPPFILPPGNTLGFNVPVLGAADGELKAFWWEEDS